MGRGYQLEEILELEDQILGIIWIFPSIWIFLQSYFSQIRLERSNIQLDKWRTLEKKKTKNSLENKKDKTNLPTVKA